MRHQERYSIKGGSTFMPNTVKDYLYWSGKATVRTVDRLYRFGPVTIRVVRLGCGCWRITLERKIRHPGFDP